MSKLASPKLGDPILNGYGSFPSYRGSGPYTHYKIKAEIADNLPDKLLVYSQLDSLFKLRRRQELEGFLEEHSFLLNVLCRLHESLTKAFSASNIYLEVLTDPEDIEPTDQLLISIATDLSVDAATEKFDLWKRDHWAKWRNSVDDLICITLEFICNSTGSNI